MCVQALLSEGGALCLELCSQGEKKGEGEGEGVAGHILEVLVRCPHTVWSLSSLCYKLAHK